MCVADMVTAGLLEKPVAIFAYQKLTGARTAHLQTEIRTHFRQKLALSIRPTIAYEGYFLAVQDCRISTRDFGAILNTI